jgi:hypothetical protein
VRNLVYFKITPVFNYEFQTIPDELKLKVLTTVHRSLIYLGDLARYREVHADKKDKQWGLARKFYTLAMQLIPDHGNPFNQLAVIDTYEGNELEAVCLYFRSLVVTFPFPTATDNLLILFQKAKQQVESPGQKSAFARFIDEFVSLQGFLFGPNKRSDKRFEIR